jgi:hypothetical protein
MFHKLCVVVDATTGQYLYAYATAPDQAQMAVAPR